VADAHIAIVIIRSTILSDLNQNERTKNQYPNAPKAEDNDKKRKNLTESPSTANWEISHAGAIALQSVATLKMAASAINAILGAVRLRSRIEITSEAA
jgi:hypothetical protein